MSLLGLMAGEVGGMPVTQPQMQPIGGLLGDPKMMLGLSLLANNNSKSFGQNLGRAGMQTIGAMQQMQQQKLINDWRASQQQLAQTRMEREQKQAEEAALKQKQQQEAEQAFLTQHPEIDQTLFKLNPQLAMKQAMPQQDNSYYQAIPTPNGLAKFNARTGELELIKIGNGAPVMKSADSPELQGRLAEAKARGAAGYRVNTDIPGRVSTDRQVAEMATGQPRAPMQAQPTQQPAQQAAPMTQGSQNVVPRNIQAQRDMTAIEVLKDEYANTTDPRNKQLIAQELKDYHNVDIGNIGIKVPTKAEEAGQVELAKLGAKDSSADRSSLKQMERSLPNLEKLVTELSDLGKKATYTMAGKAVDGVRRQLGLPVGEGAIARREYVAKVDNEILPLLRQTFGAAFTAKEGESLKATLGDVDASPEEKDAVLRAFIDTKRNQIKGMRGEQIMPRNEPMPSQVDAQPLPDKPSAMTLKRGTVYETPKGALRWNGKAFEDL